MDTKEKLIIFLSVGFEIHCCHPENRGSCFDMSENRKVEILDVLASDLSAETLAEKLRDIWKLIDYDNHLD